MKGFKTAFFFLNCMEDNLGQEQVWDAIAPLWNKYKTEQFGNRGGLIGNLKLLEGFIEKSDKKILDLGCGSGRNFFKFNGIIYGVDFSKEQLKFAEQNAKKKGFNVKLFRSEAYNLPFEDNFFDKALFISTLHSIKTNESRTNSLRELNRVLKLEGRAIITVWNKNSKRWKNKPKEKMVSWDLGDGNKVLRYYYLYDSDELRGDLEKAGFKVVKESRGDARNLIFIVEKQ